MSKHTDVYTWLAGFSSEMIIYAFLLGFFSPSYQKEWYECMPKHTDVYIWLAGFSGEMVIYAFFLGFFSLSYQKEWYEC